MILLPERISAALQVVWETLSAPGGPEWAVSGSMALALYGLPVVPKDIDLQTDREGADLLAKRMAQYLVYPPGLHMGVRLVRSYLAQYRIDDVVVEAMGALEYQNVEGHWRAAPDFRQGLQMADYRGLDIPVVSLEYLLEFYTQLQRPARAALVEARLREARA